MWLTLGAPVTSSVADDMSSREPERQYWWQIAAAGAFGRRLAAPPWHRWPAPSGAAAAWTATHVAAMAVLVAALATSSWAEPWRQAVAVLWVVGTSGLVTRVAARLAHPVPAPPPTVAAQRWVGRFPDGRSGAYIALSQATWLVIQPLGRQTVAVFVTTLALTLGARAAGLDSWEGLDRPAGFYVRALFSVRGLVAGLVALVSTAVLFWSFAVVVDPVILPEATEQIWGVPSSRRAQYATFVFSVAVLLPPVLVVCEAISAVGRYQRAVEDELAQEERANERLAQRDDIGKRLHGEVASLTDALDRCTTADERRAVLVDLQVTIRRLSTEFDDTNRRRSVGAVVGRAVDIGTRSRLAVGVRWATEGHAVDLAADRASLLERLLLVLVGNSVRAGGRSATLHVSVTATVDVTYWDDAGGYDPDVALARGGGLADVAVRLERIGGSLAFDRYDGVTVARARMPR